MASLNKVLIIGNLGRDPEMRYLPSGAAMLDVSKATVSRLVKSGTLTLNSVGLIQVGQIDRIIEARKVAA